MNDPNPCQKATFETREEANERKREIQSEDDGRKKPIRTYLCKRCRKYHLTSMSRKQYYYHASEEARRRKRIRRAANYFIEKNNW